MEFGDIFWVPEKFAPFRGVGKHWIVVLFFNKKDNVVYFQTLQSGLHKIFPSFGLFADGQCVSRNSLKEYTLYQMYKRVPSTFLDVDTVTFLNPKKYSSFLTKETYIFIENVEKDNLFDFFSKVSSRKYQYFGKLTEYNKRNLLNAMASSTKLSPSEKNNIIEIYRQKTKL